MILFVDVPWLLQRQEEVVPESADVADYSSLDAVVARHRCETPRLGYTPDSAWRAAALLATIVTCRPLPARNERFGSLCAVQYMHLCGEGIDAPFGELIKLCASLHTGTVDVFGVAAAVRSWRV
ncbi:toxin Doc [Streptomyces sp. NPDC050738]|uniref:toxin Doc n=1 Tax=Streptomyces sp. NPDC050738 TaxID=3154744 RepID=UPI00342E3225